MRFSLQKLVLGVVTIILLQLVVYLWRNNKIKRHQTVYVLEKMQIPRTVKDGTCDVNRCNPIKEGMINVHLIPHSHDDVGWLKTAEQYFTGDVAMGPGRSQYPGRECVRCVLNTTIPALLANPERRFIFIEMAFLSRFWDEISPSIKTKIKELIKDRRLELAIGGWCMSDAATTFYNDIIDQHTLGFDFIEKHFGRCAQSRFGWHVDQFGHSREHSSIFAQMGFDGLFVGRIDYQDYNHRHKNKEMEFLWKSSASLGEKASLFTHVSYDGYYAPRELQFEGRPAHSVDSASTRYVSDMIRIAKERASVFQTDHLMFPMGADFAYKNAEEWFTNMDSLIKHTNAKQKDGQSMVNLLYSTPSCYLHYVNKELKNLPTKADDFFPYAIPPKAYWTGYFTSRAGLKLHVKKAGATLQACKELNALLRFTEYFDSMEVLKRAQGILQHHDAITGTEKEHVANDYNLLLSQGETECERVIDNAYKILLSKNKDSAISRQEFCRNLNISDCTITESEAQFVMNAYNPLSRPVETFVRLPISDKKYSIQDSLNNDVKFDIIPISESIRQIAGRKSTAANEMVFPVQIPPFGYSSVFVTTEMGDKSSVKITQPQQGTDFVIENTNLVVKFDGITGVMKSVKNLRSGMEVNVKQDFYFYVGDTSIRASGAYVFIPKYKNPTKIRGTGAVKVKIFKGNNVQEVHQVFSDWVSQVIRIYQNEKHVELEWQVGPIPDQDYQGREVISHFQSDIVSNGEFYADSNGREMIKRKRDHRETWPLDVVEPVSGNYYPITSKMFIQGSESRLTLMTDRCQAGGSIQDGAMELMVHRRLYRDDGLGVSENLNELGANQRGIVYKGKHYLFVDTIENSNALTREMALKIHLAPTLSFMKVAGALSDYKSSTNNLWSGLRKSVPPNINILTLDQTLKGENEIYLLRLEHIFETHEHPEFSKPASLVLEDLFEPFDIVAITELSLGANFHADEVNRMQWKTKDGGISPTKIGSEDTKGLKSPFEILLQPMEIRTFRVQVANRL